MRKAKYKLVTLIRNTLPLLAEHSKFGKGQLFRRRDLLELLLRVYGEQAVECDSLSLYRALTVVLKEKTTAVRVGGIWYHRQDEFTTTDQLDEHTASLKEHQSMLDQGMEKHYRRNADYRDLMGKGLSLAEAKLIVAQRRKQ